VPRLGATKRLYLGRKIGVERRQLNSGLGIRDRKCAAFLHPQTGYGFFGKQDAETISDLAEFGFHASYYNLSYNSGGLPRLTSSGRT